MLFCLAKKEQTIFVGTGNDGQLFAVEPAEEQQKILYKNEQASQITAVAISGRDTYIGTANPAKLIKLGERFSSEGSYISKLVDGSQPAQWGKLQVDADIPEDCSVWAACRSGNVKDINSPTFSAWTKAVELKDPIELDCPVARFCQYKLILKSNDGKKSPLVREIAVAYTVPNLPPKVESLNVSRMDTPNRPGILKISYKARDENKDKLIYRIDFRKAGRQEWIKIKDEIEQENFEWEGRTVEDGRYEIRLAASDERSNTPETKLADSRISDPVVVDNTGPVIGNVDIKIDDSKKTATMKLTAPMN